jgi:hypothetical protein
MLLHKPHSEPIVHEKTSGLTLHPHPTKTSGTTYFWPLHPLISPYALHSHLIDLVILQGKPKTQFLLPPDKQHLSKGLFYVVPQQNMDHSPR